MVGRKLTESHNKAHGATITIDKPVRCRGDGPALVRRCGVIPRKGTSLCSRSVPPASIAAVAERRAMGKNFINVEGMVYAKTRPLQGSGLAPQQLSIHHGGQIGIR